MLWWFIGIAIPGTTVQTVWTSRVLDLHGALPTLTSVGDWTVLVADDDSDARELIALVLPPAGFEVVGRARDGDEAVSLTMETRPDLVLLDLNMPGVGGAAAAERIAEAVPTTKIVMLSASSEGDSPRADDLPPRVLGFVSKEPPFAKFAERLRELMMGSEAERA